MENDNTPKFKWYISEKLKVLIEVPADKWEAISKDPEYQIFPYQVIKANLDYSPPSNEVKGKKDKKPKTTKLTKDPEEVKELWNLVDELEKEFPNPEKLGLYDWLRMTSHIGHPTQTIPAWANLQIAFKE